MTIETTTKQEKIGDFIDYDENKQVYKFEIDGEKVRYTKESVKFQDIIIRGDKVMKEVERRFCTVCANDKIFYDSEKGEHYCPVCEQ
jgi:CRISPR/Cas system-associated exonuclease Cas4 (RecB family)